MTTLFKNTKQKDECVYMHTYLCFRERDSFTKRMLFSPKMTALKAKENTYSIYILQNIAQKSISLLSYPTPQRSFCKS